MPPQPQDAAKAVVVEFMHLCADKKDGAAAAKLLTKASRESGQFEPNNLGAGSYTVGNPQPEGQAFVVPVTMSADGQSMTVPAVVVLEAGAWRIDLEGTMNKLMGGMQAALQTAATAMGEAMGQALESVGDALGEAMAGKPAKASKPAKKKKK